MRMGNMLGTYKIYIFFAIGVVLALAAAWWSLSGEPQSASPLVTSQGTLERTPEAGVVDTLLQLRAVSLSGMIFSDPAFARLQVFGTQIIPHPA